MLEFFLMTLLLLTGIFLILLVLIQRGRGGGLAGAFGGMGGQSAFGTKAGDMFTRVTIGAAFFWIVLCAASVKLLGTPESKISSDLGGAATLPDDEPGATTGKGDDKTPGATGEKDTGGDKDKAADKESPADKSPAAEIPAKESTPAAPAEKPAAEAPQPSAAPADAPESDTNTPDSK